MDIKLELIKIAVRLLSEKTVFLAKPTYYDNVVSTLLTGETVEDRTAKHILSETEKMVETVSRMRLNRKFKKITKNF